MHIKVKLAYFENENYNSRNHFFFFFNIHTILVSEQRWRYKYIHISVCWGSAFLSVTSATLEGHVWHAVIVVITKKVEVCVIILASISASPLEGSIALFISQWIFLSAAHWLLKENMDRKLDMRYCLSLNVKQDFQQQNWHSFSGLKKYFVLNKKFECGLMWMSLVCVKNAAAQDNNFYNKCWCRALHATSVCTLQTYQLSIFSPL